MPAPTKKTALALLAGVANALSFAPLAWWPLCPLSLAVLFTLWQQADHRQAAWYGFTFGIGMFGAGTSWMYVSLNTYGGMPAALAAICIAGLVLVVALFPAAAGLIQSLLHPRRQAATPPNQSAAPRLLLIMPAIWLGFEWLRGWVLTGYPWLTAGYAMPSTPLAGFAPIGGVYLVSLATLATAGALALLATHTRIRQTNAILIAAIPTAAIWLTGWQLTHIAWTQPHGAPIQVAIIQNNIPLLQKWNRTQRTRIINTYLTAADQHRDADLIVWPEAAIPDYLDTLPANFYRRITKHGADFIFGVLTRQTTNGTTKIYNSIAAVTTPTKTNTPAEITAAANAIDTAAAADPTAPPATIAAKIALYHKHHLVPFGEFLPARWLFAPILRLLKIPMSNLHPWHPPQAPLHAAGINLAASLCYEDAFPEDWRHQVPQSGALINLSEDTWFGDSLAPHQRLQMARFRALETARPMIRASNNGLSSTIDWKGNITAQAPQFTQHTLTTQIHPRTGTTPHTNTGNTPTLLLTTLLALTGILQSRRRRI